MNPILDNEEEELVQYIESGDVISVTNLESEKSRFQNMAKSYASKKKAINIRLPESGLPFEAKLPNAQTQNIMQEVLDRKNLDDFSIDELWIEEAKKRKSEIENQTVSLLDSKEVFQKIFQKYQAPKLKSKV